MTVSELLTLQLPDYMDTNETYQLVGPDGRSDDVVWDMINNRWTCLPF